MILIASGLQTMRKAGSEIVQTTLDDHSERGQSLQLCELKWDPSCHAFLVREFF
jgi:hypothetical protein